MLFAWLKMPAPVVDLLVNSNQGIAD